MKTQGHIAWAGQAWIGPGIGLFLGQAGHNQAHRHMAVQLAIGLDGAVRVWAGDVELCAPVVAIRAGTSHRIEAGRLLSVYLDPFCAEARALGLSKPLQGLELGEPDALLLALQQGQAPVADDRLVELPFHAIVDELLFAMPRALAASRQVLVHLRFADTLVPLGMGATSAGWASSLKKRALAPTVI